MLPEPCRLLLDVSCQSWGFSCNFNNLSYLFFYSLPAQETGQFKTTLKLEYTTHSCLQYHRKPIQNCSSMNKCHRALGENYRSIWLLKQTCGALSKSSSQCIGDTINISWVRKPKSRGYSVGVLEASRSNILSNKYGYVIIFGQRFADELFLALIHQP